VPIDPQARALLDLMARVGAPEPGTVSVEELRRVTAKRRLALPAGPEVRVDATSLGAEDGRTIAARVYRPESERPLPVLMWFHGGGFVLGSVPESDGDCRHLATLSGCAVVSVEYRLAPEHPFPAGLEDCMAATSWVHAHAGELGLDPSRMAVGGDSAGGNLATCVARHGAVPLRFQLLIYPITDLASLDTPSYHANARGYYLSRAAMEWLREQYVPHEADRAKPAVSPLRAPDLHGLPPAFVVTAELDPLRDEGDAYARRLQEAGVRVTHRRYDGMIHGFFSMYTHLDAGKRVMRDAAEALRAALFAVPE
jgi:acetyl esterase